MSVVSVDLWGTLIKSSPFFVDAKVELTKKYFPELSTNQILKCYSDTKKELNCIIEQTGWQPTSKIMFDLLINKLNKDFSKMNFLPLVFYHKYQDLAKIHSPIIWSDETKEYVEKLSVNNTLILSSNTLLINEIPLIEALRKTNMAKCFSVFKFSCIEGISKPNPLMYHNSDYHIGDNLITDGQGAFSAGSKPIIINSTNLTIKDAYNIITQGK